MSDITMTHPQHPGVVKAVKASAVVVYEANGWVRKPTPKSTNKTKRPDGADKKEQS
ncbi:MAG TPA: hypothetical protein VFJ14_17940 [Nocardioidaceae bacterium]|nr:hypothetical protein [Nocardioidaceae bacterium]